LNIKQECYPFYHNIWLEAYLVEKKLPYIISNHSKQEGNDRRVMVVIVDDWKAFCNSENWRLSALDWPKIFQGQTTLT
jgi:hypothetical protein